MKRMLSAWLPAWPIARLNRDEPGLVPRDDPFVLVELSVRGIVVTAVNDKALLEGISPGTLLADARAALPGLKVRPAEKSRDTAALSRLAQWAGRYGPSRNHDGDDGFWADITGVAHLFGGEEGLVGDLIRRLDAFGVPARVGLADTLGAAHALARHGGTRSGRVRPVTSWVIAPAGDMRAALAALPVEALRIDADTAVLLRRLGLKRIGDLYSIPRESLAQRFRSKDAAGHVLFRLDCALGAAQEPLVPFFEPSEFSVRRAFPEPLVSSEALEAFIRLLCEDLAAHLKEKAMGARVLSLAVYRADGTVAHAAARLRAPANDAAHFRMLLKERLAAIDAGFGVDLLALEARSAAPLKSAQGGFAEDDEPPYDPGPLIDRLSNRLGPEAVAMLAPKASHIPERSETRLAAIGAGVSEESKSKPRDFAYAPPWPYGRTPPRPAFLLGRPEPISVVAEIPDGPPARFVWRRIERRVVRAEGPERIAPEWWRSLARSEEQKRPRPRDYFRIEDEAGDAFWVFRHGLYGGEDDAEDDDPPRWFLHGLFC